MEEIVIDYKPRTSQMRIHEMMDTHRFCVVVAHRRMGKTVAMINQLLKRAVVDQKERGFYSYVAPLLKQGKAIAWEYLKHFTGPIPGRKVNEADLFVELPNRAKIRIFGADNPDALRGMYFDGIVLDEVAQMKPEVWGEIIRPALADRQGWAVFIGTPKGVNLFYDLYDLAVKDHTGEWAAKSFPLNETMRDPDPPLTPAEVESLKTETSENTFRQEFLCDFTAGDASIFIDAVVVAEAQDRDAPADNRAPLVFGLDVARFGDDRTVLVRRRGRALEGLDVWRDRDLMWTSSAVGEIIDRLRPRAVFVDSVGLGAGVVDRLRQLGHRVIGVNSGSRAGQPSRFVNLKAEMWSKMRDWLVEGASLPNREDLRRDLLAPTYDFDAQGRLKIESKDDLKGRGLPSTDLADALALTFAQPVAAEDLMKMRPKYAEGAGE